MGDVAFRIEKALVCQNPGQHGSQGFGDGKQNMRRVWKESVFIALKNDSTTMQNDETISMGVEQEIIDRGLFAMKILESQSSEVVTRCL